MFVYQLKPNRCEKNQKYQLYTLFVYTFEFGFKKNYQKLMFVPIQHIYFINNKQKFTATFIEKQPKKNQSKIFLNKRVRVI